MVRKPGGGGAERLPLIVPVGVILILVGLFTVTGGILDWQWFMSHWKSRLFVKMLGRNGARRFYVAFGLIVNT